MTLHPAVRLYREERARRDRKERKRLREIGRKLAAMEARSIDPRLAASWRRAGEKEKRAHGATP